MISYKEEYQRLLALRQKLKKTDTFQQYMELTLQTNRTSEEEEQRLKLSQKEVMQKLFLIQRNISQIDNPIDSSYFQKIAFVQKNGINPFVLKLNKDLSFPDGSSIYLWISSLVDYYMSHNNMEENVSNRLLNLYKHCVDYSTFSGKVQYLQFLLKFSNNDAFCHFLGMMPYLYPKLKSFSCGLKVINCIIETLDKKDISFYSFSQQEEIISFLVLLKKKVSSFQEVAPSCNGTMDRVLKVHSQHVEAILTYLEENPVSFIDKDKKFKDGVCVSTWLQNLTKAAYDGVENSLFDERNKQSVYKIALLLYNDKTLPLNENIPFNYGAALQRVFLVFNLRKNSIFTSLQIPHSILNKILDNQLFPNTFFIDKILFFLKQLSCETTYQKEFVGQAIEIYTSLQKYPNPEILFSYTVYPENREATYLKSIKDIDSLLLKRVKGQNCDWYIKCITLLFILRTERRVPSNNEYFYDGSFIFKWIITQKKTIFASKFSEEQKYLVSLINSHFASFSTKRVPFLTFHCDEILDAFQDAIKTYGSIRKGDLYQEQSLYNLWKDFNLFLRREDCSFHADQIKRYKTLRYQVIYNEKMKGEGRYKETDSFAFGYAFACLADSLSLSSEVLGSFLSIKKYSLSAYLGHKAIPRLENLEIIKASLEKLPSVIMEKSPLREDQLEDINSFKEFLENLIAYRKMKEEDYASFYQKILDENILSFSKNQLLEDIPTSFLFQIEQEDIEWLTTFQHIYQIIKERKAFSAYPKITSFSWFKMETYHACKGDSSLVKQILLCYLYYYDQKKCYEDKVKLFMQNFLVLETFVYEKERLPYKSEICVADGKDGATFYHTLCSFYFEGRDFEQAFLEDQLERIQSLFQFIAYLKRKKHSCVDDYQLDNCLYIGEKIDFIRISLRMYKNSFLEKMGWSYSIFENLLYNRKPLTSRQEEELLQFLEESKEFAREYQVREIIKLQEILLSRHVQENSVFCFFKKEME